MIDPTQLIDKYRKLTNDYLKELDERKQRQQQLTAHDPLLENIEELFHRRVGKPFSTQDEVKKLYDAAEERFKQHIPPGFSDAKGKDGGSKPNAYLHNGIVYIRKYGDFLLWKQILDHAKASNIKDLIFVTDHRKEDWRQFIDCNGDKQIGPHPELIEEATRDGQITNFLMYTPDRFFKVRTGASYCQSPIRINRRNPRRI